ncbi:MAG TPA: hypothetical protein VN680_00205 [Burkholderiaceae bacterium]|nr:hypothetical protein [Burkholderiaceae bacterium]
MSAKVYHYGAFIRDDGAVSAQCFDPPRPIDLKKELWTNRLKAVTCQRCIEARRDLLAKQRAAGHNKGKVKAKRLLKLAIMDTEGQP